MRLSFDQSREYFETRLSRSLPAREKIAVCCPFHDDHTPSATVFLNSGGFHCNACEAKGSILDFEMRFSHCDRETALQNIAKLTAASLNGTGKRLVSEHIYRNAEGVPVAKKNRYETFRGGKKYLWFHRNGAGKWQTKLPEGTFLPL